MQDSQRTIITAPAIVVRGNDIDTDRIIPARFLKCVVFDGLGAHAFEDDRRQEAARGAVHPFDDPRFAAGRILLVNKNFGCGSSREHAPQAIMRWGQGVQAVVGESFAEIFLGNCLALGVPCPTVDEATMLRLMERCTANPEVPVTLDLVARTIAVGDLTFPVTIPDDQRQSLVSGTWDTTGELLDGKEAIAATAARLPYFAGYAGH